jgi:hypothetical protein
MLLQQRREFLKPKALAMPYEAGYDSSSLSNSDGGFEVHQTHYLSRHLP